jgi:hypothetical protein
MANKKLWLGILVMVLVFGMTVVGCDDGSTDNSDYYGWENEPSRLEGPLFGLEFNGVETLSDYEISKLDSNAYSFGCFAGAEYPVLQGSLSYYAVKVDGVWYKEAADGIYWKFGWTGKWMQKYESIATTQGDTTTITQKLRETKSFEYVNNEQQDEIKIDGQVYKYKLERSNTKDYSYTTDIYRRSGTIRLQILKIFYDGANNAPTLYLYSTAENLKSEKIN